MIDHSALEFDRRLAPSRRRLVSLLSGFLYWLVFLLVLEPDNVLRASQAGYVLPFGLEAIRITAAALIGTTVTPLLTWLTRRFPLRRGPHVWRYIAIHLICNISLALLLIIVSCLLVAWVHERELAPSQAEIDSQLAANWTLLTFALCAFTALAQLIRFIRHPAGLGPALATPAATDFTHLDRISIKTRGRLRWVQQASIDWLETQGNYLALHVGPLQHLVRRTLTDFETELDIDRFVRIHRRVIVAIDRIEELKPLPNGDALLRLRDGQELRMSRSYRDEVLRRWAKQRS